MITRFEKVLAVLLGVWTVVVLASPAGAASSGWRQLNVNTPKQANNLCWVAASVGIMRALHRDPLKGQCTLANRVQSGNKCRYEGGNRYQVEALLRGTGIRMRYADYPVALSSIKYEINRSRPMIFSFRFLGTQNGHVSVIDGYDGRYVHVDYITNGKVYQIRMRDDHLVYDRQWRWYKARNGGGIWIAPHTWRYTYYGFEVIR